jgi:hypothetical protein
MLEASTRPAIVPGWWRRWPAWSPYAATAWAVLLPLPYGITRLAWALGVPLGVDQGRAAVGPRLGQGAPW